MPSLCMCSSEPTLACPDMVLHLYCSSCFELSFFGQEPKSFLALQRLPFASGTKLQMPI